jgi:hypothetical protein
MVYVSSRPVPQDVWDGYMELVSPDERTLIEERTLKLTPDDPSPRSLAAKLLDAPDLLEQARSWIGDDPAMIEAWNVTETERDLALALGLPIFGTQPEHWPLAIKSGGRELFRSAGIPCPAGVEHITSPALVASAIVAMRAADPGLQGVVVKLDDSVAGDGNMIIRFDGVAPGDIDTTERLVEDHLPAWYVETLRRGGVVEELIAGQGFCSPSGQANVLPDGSVDILATHDQRLGGGNGQVYEGCSMPADRAYAVEIARHVARVGRELAVQGVRGRFGVDFAAVLRAGRWELFALEINLRKGGTSHPLLILRMLTGGRYDPARGEFVLPDGSTRCYGATDNLVDVSWRTRTAVEVRDRLRGAGLWWDRDRLVGVAPHLLDCLPFDGRMGYTAIGRDRDEVARIEADLAKVLA